MNDAPHSDNRADLARKLLALLDRRVKKVSDLSEVHKWQNEHIREGLLQADARQFASGSEVAAAFARWRK